MNKYFKEFCADIRCNDLLKNGKCDAYICNATARHFFEWYNEKVKADEEIERRVLYAWRVSGSKIYAVKEYRDIVGCDVRDAVTYCNFIEYKK